MKIEEHNIPFSIIDGTLDAYMMNENLLLKYCKTIDICYGILSPYGALLYTQLLRSNLFAIFCYLFENTFEMPSICKEEFKNHHDENLN